MPRWKYENIILLYYLIFVLNNNFKNSSSQDVVILINLGHICGIITHFVSYLTTTPVFWLLYVNKTRETSEIELSNGWKYGKNLYIIFETIFENISKILIVSRVNKYFTWDYLIFSKMWNCIMKCPKEF